MLKLLVLPDVPDTKSCVCESQQTSSTELNSCLYLHEAKSSAACFCALEHNHCETTRKLHLVFLFHYFVFGPPSLHSDFRFLSLSSFSLGRDSWLKCQHFTLKTSEKTCSNWFYMKQQHNITVVWTLCCSPSSNKEEEDEEKVFVNS